MIRSVYVTIIRVYMWYGLGLIWVRSYVLYGLYVMGVHVLVLVGRMSEW